MSSPDLGTLELVDVRKIWNHEERDFTPWLADNLLRLNAVLDMNLELVAIEDRKPEAGRADILAKDTGSGANVVIENQLDWSDDSHLARLLGYAASRDAQVVIWISTGFWKWHLDIRDWLGKAGVEIYGIELSAWRIGDVVAPHFELVTGSGGRLERAEDGPATGHAAYGRFFRPLTRQLRAHGFQPMGGRQGGWTGRNRTFHTGYEDQCIYYVLQVNGDEAKSWVWLYIGCDDHQAVLDALSTYRDEIDAGLGETVVEWVSSAEEESSWVAVSNEHSITEPDGTRVWMLENLVRLRSAVQPRLDTVMAEREISDC